jgi:hypothetical protein
MPIAALICEQSKIGGCSACFSRVSLLAWEFIPRRAGRLRWAGGRAVAMGGCGLNPTAQSGCLLKQAPIQVGGCTACFSRGLVLAWGLLVWGLSLGGRGGCEAGAGFGAAGAGR